MCKYGGYLNTKAKASGFFRVEQINGRWWFVDPDGHLFFCTCSTGMSGSGGDARLQGREDYFVALPPAEATSSGSRSSFYGWNLARRHGVGVRTNWMDLALRRLDSWGLNTIGNWSDPHLWDTHRKAYQVNLGGWGMRTGYLGMPDVYADEFPRTAERDAAAQCAPRKDDPWLLGYFIANEPPWPDREPNCRRPHPGGSPKRHPTGGEGFSGRRRHAGAAEASSSTAAVEKFLDVVNAGIRRTIRTI